MEVKKFRSHLKSSKCGCLALIQERKLMRTMLRSVLSLLKLMLDSMAVSNDLQNVPTSLARIY